MPSALAIFRCASLKLIAMGASKPPDRAPLYPRLRQAGIQWEPHSLQGICFGPDLLETVWDGLTVSHHCTVSRGENPIGVLFRMEHPTTDECSAFSSYRFEGIDGTCRAALLRSTALMDQ